MVGTWKAPSAGDTINDAGGRMETWKKLSFSKDGAIQSKALMGGYAYVAVSVKQAGIWMLEAAGHNLAYVNGEIRAGDPYSHGYLHVPVYLREGANDLLFLVGRGQLRVKFTQPKASLFFSRADALLPDVLEGGKKLDGSVVVVNASIEPVHAVIDGNGKNGNFEIHKTDPILIRPLSVRKIGFVFKPADTVTPGNANFSIRLVSGGDKATVRDTWEMKVVVVKPMQTHRRTFVSKIDGSIQYYAVNPASGLKKGEAPALFLTLHGASVEASGQASAYPHKEWGHLVAPTNRRSFGFDWEDWGRLDALEVLEIARKDLGTDPKRTYLTGHSMGGHGTWHLGVTYPEKWAAIGPSAGWMSFWSYGSGPRKKPETPMEEVFYRSNNGSDTSLLARNLSKLGVYVLHGDADDNVPVDQSRGMKLILAGFHKDFEYHEQPKAGHWWGGAKEGGCVDWKPMFDMFEKRRIHAPGEVRKIDFTTANPGVSSTYHWLEILAQAKSFELSEVKIDHDPDKRTFEGSTINVARVSLDLGHLKAREPVQVTLDNETFKEIDWPEGVPKLWFERQGDKWRMIKKPSSTDKGPHRYGPFRDAFRNRMVFVVGTKGSPAETAWAWGKARFDAETWWYRGNGSVEIVADVDFRPVQEKDCNIILYGNADCHSLWKELLGKCTVQVQRGKVVVGKRTLDGDDLACLFITPRPGSDTASIGVISGTGVVGMRLSNRMPIFVSGMAYPDCMIVGADMLANSFRGVRAAGYFGNDWSVGNGDFAWE